MISVHCATGSAGGRIPGNKAIWVGIYAELTEFALMFLVYFVARAHHPEAFTAGARRLSTLAGSANTVISSLAASSLLGRYGRSATTTAEAVSAG